MDEILKDCVSTTLKGVLGKTPAEALLFHLGDQGSVRNPRAFSESLERVTGSGAEIIEKMIVKAIYRKIGMNVDENAPFDFEGSVNGARVLLAKKGSGS